METDSYFINKKDLITNWIENNENFNVPDIKNDIELFIPENFTQEI